MCNLLVIGKWLILHLVNTHKSLAQFIQLLSLRRPLKKKIKWFSSRNESVWVFIRCKIKPFLKILFYLDRKKEQIHHEPKKFKATFDQPQHLQAWLRYYGPNFLQNKFYSEKLRQTKCLLYNFWMIKFTVISKKVIWYLAIWPLVKWK